MKKSNRLYYILGAAIVLLTGVAFWKGKNRPKGEKVTTEIAQRRTIKESVSASGKVFPEVEVKISSDVSGEVVELYVQEGDTVTKGQLLVRVNPDSYVPSVERGQANVNSAKAQSSQVRAQIENYKARKAQSESQLLNAQTTHKRNEQLFKEGVISQAEYDNSAANLRSAEANIRSAEADIIASGESARASEYTIEGAQASLRELRTSLKKTSIYAPMSGIVSRLNIEKGERVVGTIQMTGTEIMRIADMSKMEVQVDVTENDVPRVSIGDEVDIDIDSYIGRKFKGHVMKIANTASNVSTTGATTLTSDQVTNFVVKIRIDPASYADLMSKGRKHPFRPGMSASVEIMTNSVANVLSVPIQCVTTRDKLKVVGGTTHEGEIKPGGMTVQQTTKYSNDAVKEVVFVMSGDSVRMIEVKTGIQDDTYIELTEGLKDNEEIVAGPYDIVSRKLKQGDKVYKEKEEKKKE